MQNVALDLGYESASAFVTMFRKTPGQAARAVSGGTPHRRVIAVRVPNLLGPH